MVKLDRVEMLRSAFSGSGRGQRTIDSPDEGHSVAVATQKQKLRKITTDRISNSLTLHQVDEYREEGARAETTPVDDSREESREDAAVHNDVFDSVNDNESVFIEAEFETVLEPDFILTARDEPEEREREEEDFSHKSDTIHEPIIPPREEEQPTAHTQTKQLLTTVGEDSVVDYGIEVQYGRSSLPFTTTEEDQSIGPGESVKTEITSVAEEVASDETKAEVELGNSGNEIENPEGDDKESPEDEKECDIKKVTEKENAEDAETTHKVVSNEATAVQATQVPTEAKSHSAKVHVSSVPTKLIEDAGKNARVDDQLPSLPSRDATWSFDTTLKRRKTTNVAKNIFLGFSEEDIKNAEDITTNILPEENGTDISKNNTETNEARAAANEQTTSDDTISKEEKSQPADGADGISKDKQEPSLDIGNEEVQVDENEQNLQQDTAPVVEESQQSDEKAATFDHSRMVATEEDQQNPQQETVPIVEESQQSDDGEATGDHGQMVATDDSNQFIDTSAPNNSVTDVSSDEDVVQVGKDDSHSDKTTEEETSESKEFQPTEDDISTNTSNQVPSGNTESHEEIVEVHEAGPGNLDSQSQEFEAVLENIADLIENSDWDAFIATITARPSLATLSSVDFFPSECKGFLAVGASENLLLHEVCKNEPSVEAVSTLIEVHDAAVTRAGQWGYLPLHCACASGASEDVIRVLLKAHPESVEAFGDDKMLALHLASKRGAPMGVFKLLLGAYPSGCAAVDVYDKTPMDYVMSQTEGPERTKKIELLSSQVQIMYLSAVDLKWKLRESEEKSTSIRNELIEKRRKVMMLEKELKELGNKTIILEGDLTEKQERTSGLGEQLITKQEKMVELETQLGVERAKASVFGENLKQELAKSSNLEVQLRQERITSSNLAKELKSNADEWSILGAEMEEEFKKSANELLKERRRIAALENRLREEEEKSSNLERQLNNQHQILTPTPSLDVALNNKHEESSTVEDKLANAKLEWLLEKQEIYEKADANLAEAYRIMKDSHPDVELSSENNEAKDEAHPPEVLEEIENKLKEKHVMSLLERQAIYEKVECQFAEAYKIICKTENDLKEERSKWIMERQNILERNDRNMTEAFKILCDTEMSLTEKENKLAEYEGMLDEHQKQIQQGQDKSKSLVRQLELAKAVSGERLSGLVDELNTQKSFSESQSKQIDALESSIEQKLSDASEYAKDQQERLAYEKSMADEIRKKINEKKMLMKENEEMISALEKNNLMKQELLEAQQKKVEALESGRREKETQLKLNQRVLQQLEESIAKKQALEKEEIAEASKLAGTRASRKAAIDIEEDQIKELDYTLARKQALIELEKMKEKTLQQTLAQKHELIESEVARIKELESLIQEKQMHLKTERNSNQALKVATAEKDALLLSERNVVGELRRTQKEKESVLQAQTETEALLESKVENEQSLLDKKQAAIDGVKEARQILETELENQKKATSALENQIVKKKNLITKEEYVAKCLQHLSLHKREFMPPGAASYFVNAYFGMQFRANSGMKLLLKETHLVSNFIKTHLREHSVAIRKRRDAALALVPIIPAVTAIKTHLREQSVAIRQRRDEALALVSSIPEVTVPGLGMCRTAVTKGPRSLLARLKSYGVNVDLFPKSYGAATAPEKKKHMPESKLPKWKEKDSE